MHATFVASPQFKPSTTRAEVWDHWLTTVSLLRDAVDHVCCAWLGGSFTSAEIDPNDIDSVFVIEATNFDAVVAAQDSKTQILQHIAVSNLKTVGLKVDSYVLRWVVNPDPAPTPDATEYLGQRGYWDDFWQRRRSGPKGSPPQRRDALPLRGYLEVMLDGFVE